MGTDHPLAWAREKRHRLRAYASGEVAEWTRKARDVCLPGVPLAAIDGFFANGKLDSNTTGWIAGDARERTEALTHSRKPLGGDPTKGYGHVGGDDLHELGPGGVEGNRCPAPVATGTCPWVSLATSAEVVEVLGQADVAVVVAHHAVARVDQRLHEGRRPGDELHAQAHDQQHHRTLVLGAVGAGVFDFDGDAVCFDFHS